LEPDNWLWSRRDRYDLLTLAEESAQIGIWDRDIATSLMRGTPTFFRIMGLPPMFDPVHMDVIRAVRHPEDAARVVEGFQQALAKGLDSYEAEYRIIRPSDGQVRWIFGRGRTVRDVSGKPVRYSGVDIDITERKQAEEHMRRLMHEVNHRANNLLAVVQAIAQHTLHSTVDPAEFVESLSRRIAGLAASNNLLVSGKWQGIEIEQLAKSQLAHFIDHAHRVELSGPSLRLTPSAAQAVGMALHELATNAAKHGALSNADGRVRVSWAVCGEKPHRLFAMDWTEKDGPTVSAPRRTGFGHVVTGPMMEEALAGKARCDFLPAGMRWSFHGLAELALEGD
jgi:PAS domain S-box-containing protein